jgi:hypothetical protein
LLFRTSRNWLSRQDQCQTRKNSCLHSLIYRNLKNRPILSGSKHWVATPHRLIEVVSRGIKAFPSHHPISGKKRENQGFLKPMSYLGPIITIYRTRCHTLPGGPNPTNNLDVYNLFGLPVREPIPGQNRKTNLMYHIA